MGQIVSIATNQIVMMFLLMGVGYLLYRRHFLTDAGISQMSDLVLFVANPVLIAMALMRPFDAAVFQGALWVAAVSVTTLLLSIVLGFVAYRDPQGRHAAMGRFSTIFSNTAFSDVAGKQKCWRSGTARDDFGQKDTSPEIAFGLFHRLCTISFVAGS